MSIQKFPKNMPQRGCLVIKIFNISGHYGILADVQEFEMDLLNIEYGEYRFIQNLDGELDEEYYRIFTKIKTIS